MNSPPSRKMSRQLSRQASIKSIESLRKQEQAGEKLIEAEKSETGDVSSCICIHSFMKVTFSNYNSVMVHVK